MVERQDTGAWRWWAHVIVCDGHGSLFTIDGIDIWVASVLQTKRLTDQNYKSNVCIQARSDISPKSNPKERKKELKGIPPDAGLGSQDRPWELEDMIVGGHKDDSACNGMHLYEDRSQREENAVCLCYSLNSSCRAILLIVLVCHILKQPSDQPRLCLRLSLMAKTSLEMVDQTSTVATFARQV